MSFEVNKFLALTALLAGATVLAAGCSSSDAKKAPGGSDAGDAGESSVQTGAGTGNATNEGGAAGATEAQGGTGEGGTGEGGASEGGAAGASVGACIADIVGAAGAADESTPCGQLGAAGAPDCGDEGGNYVAQGCNQLYGSAVYRPSVVLAFNECATALADSCDANGVRNCATSLIGEGCMQPDTAASCAFIESKCPGTTLCTGVMNLATPGGQAAIADCMDPSSENYIEYKAGDCNVNLQYCASLPVPALN
ncbi:MAG: hypothetical protein ABIQ16_07965 [Polyangiaceae bacterium]